MPFRRIGHAALHQLGDDAHHVHRLLAIGHEIGGARGVRRIEDVQRLQVLVELRHRAFGQVAHFGQQRALPRPPIKGALVDLVVHVRDVAGIGDVVSP
jgi:hypothetical protein